MPDGGNNSRCNTEVSRRLTEMQTTMNSENAKCPTCNGVLTTNLMRGGGWRMRCEKCEGTGPPPPTSPDLAGSLPATAVEPAPDGFRRPPERNAEPLRWSESPTRTGWWWLWYPTWEVPELTEVVIGKISYIIEGNPDCENTRQLEDSIGEPWRWAGPIERPEPPHVEAATAASDTPPEGPRKSEPPAAIEKLSHSAGSGASETEKGS